MKKYLLLVLAAVLLLVCWLYRENNALTVTEFTVRDPEIPEGFSGFRIAQISDLHNARFGAENEKLLTLLAETRPDIIVITGDMADARRTDLAVAEAFAEAAVKIAPCYYVTGNHEGRIEDYPRLEQALRDAGVHVLRNEGGLLHRNGQTITLLGMDDLCFDIYQRQGPWEEVFQVRIREMAALSDGYTILLSHRPEKFDDYVAHGFDLVFAGHLHGGQIRMPFVGGLYMPGQGLFPRYDAGVFTREDTVMVVSRGLGNSAFPQRINNRPEIVLTVLESE